MWTQKIKSILVAHPSLEFDIYWGFFYGTSQGNLPKCKIIVVLYLNASHYFHFDMLEVMDPTPKLSFFLVNVVALCKMSLDDEIMSIFSDSKVVIIRLTTNSKCKLFVFIPYRSRSNTLFLILSRHLFPYLHRIKV